MRRLPAPAALYDLGAASRGLYRQSCALSHGAARPLPAPAQCGHSNYPRGMMTTSALLLAAALSTASPGDGMFEPRLVSDNGVFGFTLSPDGQHALWVQSGGARTKLVIVE